MSAVRQRRPAATRTSLRAISPAELAWILALPCALITAALVAALGAPLGRALLSPGSEHFWSPRMTRPEPEEHGRFALSLLGPLLLGIPVLLSARWRRPARERVVRWLVVGGQVALVAFLALCLAAQNDVVSTAYRSEYLERAQYFTPRTLLVALALPALALALLRRPAVRRRVASLVRETRARRIACVAIAALVSACWLLTALDTDGSIGNTFGGVIGHILWSMDETFAILNGRTPFVNFHPQYSQLWPYLVAAAMAVLGTSLGVYTGAMITISGVVLLAVFGVFRRIVRSSVLALALFGPFVATGFFMKLGTIGDRFGPANLFSLWPARFGGPYLVAWLLARHLDRAAPRRPVWIFGLAGLAALNNPEFGVPALAATVIALLLVQPTFTRRALAQLALAAIAGLAGAVALVVALTAIRSGSLPRFGLLFEFSRLYGVGGWAMLPMPRLGIFLWVYVTFAAAVVVAAARRARGDDQPVLTALLAWIGAFGLLSGSYFAGRSHPQVLIDLFSPWTFALALLAVVAVRSLAARGWRRPALAELAVLFGFAIAACSLAQLPTPWSQWHRIRDLTPTQIFKEHGAARFVERTTRPGERVAILIPLGHRIAYDTGRVNVSPYSSIESIPTLQQMRTMIAALHAAGGHKIYLAERFTLEQEPYALQELGFTTRATSREPLSGELFELSDVSPAPRPRR